MSALQRVGRGACVLSALLHLSCGSDFNERSEITGLRVLAISAAPPWIVPSQAARLTPLVVGLSEAERAQLQYRWSWCPLRGPNSANFQCLVSAELLNTATGTSGISIPPDIFDLGSNPTAELGYLLQPQAVGCFCNALRGAIPAGCEPFETIAASSGEVSRFITLPPCDGTFPVSVKLDLRLGERQLLAYKDVTLVYDLSRSQALNALPDVSNLAIERIDRDGNLITDPTPHEATVRFRLQPDPGQTPLDQLDRLSEAFTATRTEALDDGTTRTFTVQTREQLLFSWFSETGLFDASRTGFLPDTIQNSDRPDGIPIAEAWDTTRENFWEAPKPGDFPGGETRIYLVVRDGRGGTSWTTSTVAVGTMQ